MSLCLVSWQILQNVEWHHTSVPSTQTNMNSIITSQGIKKALFSPFTFPLHLLPHYQNGKKEHHRLPPFLRYGIQVLLLCWRREMSEVHSRWPLMCWADMPIPLLLLLCSRAVRMPRYQLLLNWLCIEILEVGQSRLMSSAYRVTGLLNLQSLNTPHSYSSLILP